MLGDGLHRHLSLLKGDARVLQPPLRDGNLQLIQQLLQRLRVALHGILRRGLAGGGGGGGVLLAGRGVTSGSATSGGQAAGLLGGGGELLEAEHQRVAHAQHVLQLLHAALELGDALAGVVEGHVLVVHGRTHLLRTLRVERDEVGAQHGDALLLERAKVGAREDVHVEEVHLEHGQLVGAGADEVAVLRDLRATHLRRLGDDAVVPPPPRREP
mmetsp:Transcript_22132/g.57675  ORF Transcript_22132/g.57675 Transcript_22132/m.57675 type:complete len:214 (+) Transcript_22132:705-1346(+)